MSMSPSTATDTPHVYLVRGDDPVLMGEAVRVLVHELAGGDDPGLVVEDLAGDDYEMVTLVDAAQTPPFLTDRRVVVARQMGRFTSEQVEPLVTYLADPLPTTFLVLVAGGGSLAPTLVRTVKNVGQVIEASTPAPRQRGAWIAEQVKHAGISLDARATKLVAEHLGEDVSRLGGLLRVLEEAYGSGAKLGEAEVEPFLGQAGGTAPWSMTDAIDAGDTAAALVHLRRILHGSRRHPLEVLATLHSHYARMMRLDGAEAADEAAAAAVLGLTGSTFPARKALSQGRRLGHEGVKRAMQLLAQADLDLKGTRDLPGEAVLEVLVARLSRLIPAGASARRSRH